MTNRKMSGLPPTVLLLLALAASVNSEQSPSIRLTRGSNPWTGYLEVFHNGRWGNVCDDEWNGINAHVACRQLGLDGGSGNSQFHGSGNQYGLSYWLDDLKCTGTELRIEDCAHRPWGQNDCGEEVVRITCSPSGCQKKRANGLRCQNGGVYMPAGDNNCCACHSYYVGETCELEDHACRYDNGGCSHKCTDFYGGHNCSCPDTELELGPDQHTCYSPHAGITCTSDGMSVNLKKAGLPGVKAEQLVSDGAGPQCVARDTPSSIIFNLPLNDCGTTRTEENGEWVYENHVLSGQQTAPGLVSTVRKLNVTVRCRYPKQLHVHQSYNVHSQPISFLHDVHGHFPVRLELVQGGNVYQPGEMPLVVDPGAPLTLHFSLNHSDPDLQLFPRNCYATPTANIRDPATHYHLIKDGCIQDDTLQEQKTGDDDRLTLQAFKFLGSSDTVFLHCDVMICNSSDVASRCQQGCLQPSGTSTIDPTASHVDSRALRSFTFLDEKRLSYGPLHLSHLSVDKALDE